MDGGPGDRLGSHASLAGHRAGRHEFVECGREDVPGIWVLYLASGRLERKERRSQQMGILSREVEVTPPGRQESSDGSGGSVGLVDEVDFVEHPLGEIPASHRAHLRQKRIPVGNVTVDRSRRHLEPASHLAQGDGIRSA